MERKRYWWKAIVSIAVTLTAMPVTHIIARVLKNSCTGVEEFYAGLAMGGVGMLLVIIGVFVRGDVKQTLCGLFGGMVYWMGAIDILFMYYAQRYGTQAQLDPMTGEIASRPEYLLLQATFGFWAMTMLLYLFCAANGCNFINWWQRLLFGKRKKEIGVEVFDHIHVIEGIVAAPSEHLLQTAIIAASLVAAGGYALYKEKHEVAEAA